METDTAIKINPPPGITPEQISQLVDVFYAKVRHNERLGQIFNTRLDGKWPEHLDKLKSFWRSVLLATGEYNGRPVPAHNRIDDMHSDDFATWLSLFDETADSVFYQTDAAFIKEKARRIARSLWLARFGTPFNHAPNWQTN
jgi:hemoglobin